MKKLFTLAAFFFVVAISSSALAANWVLVATHDNYGGTPIDLYVDKDSIRRSTNPKFSQPDGVLAVVKQASNNRSEAGILGFWSKDGKKYFDYLTYYLNGSSDIYNGMVVDDAWEIVWDYVHNNLP